MGMEYDPILAVCIRIDSWRFLLCLKYSTDFSCFGGAARWIRTVERVFMPFLLKSFNISRGGLLFGCNGGADQLLDRSLFGLLPFQPCQDVGVVFVVEFEADLCAVHRVIDCLLLCPFLPFPLVLRAVVFAASECFRHAEFFAVCHGLSSL